MAAKPKTVFILGALAIVIAAVAAVSLYNYLKGQEARVKEAVATEKVVVASQDIATGSAINSTQVKVGSWPKANLPQGTFSSTEQVVGRVALERYLPGEPIIEAKLVPKEGPTGILTYKIPQGHRAMTVAVDQVAGVAGFLMPGNRVDVVLTVAPTGSGQQQISKIVLQDVPVFATGQIIEQQKEGKPVVVPTVTMDVTPDDAEKLAIASTQGRLQLVLRRAGDTDVAKTGGATVTKVLGGATAPETKVAAASQSKTAKKTKKKEEPKKAQQEKEKPSEVIINVEVLKGSQKKVETFKVE